MNEAGCVNINFFSSHFPEIGIFAHRMNVTCFEYRSVEYLVAWKRHSEKHRLLEVTNRGHGNSKVLKTITLVSIYELIITVKIK